MRLLKCTPGGDINLVLVSDDSPPPYAILSHTWDHGQEVTYEELVACTSTGKTGYGKIRFCIERAAADGIEYSWVDTCCIDKSDQQEFQTAINSMFKWYQTAKRCYVYLSDVEVPEEVSDVQRFRIAWVHAFRTSQWFTRGWTLQELLAPASVEFFSKDRRLLGSRISLEQDIHEVTRIPIAALRGQRLTEFSVEERIAWVAGRSTTVKEDKVYCLLGIFGVFLPLIYGEGEAHAESRLRSEIRRLHGGREKERVEDLPVSSSLLPFPRNEQFSGRESELQSLEHFLRMSTHRRITVHGLGGCGKSALAIELAYRVIARNARHLVFWVPAMSRDSFELAFREIGIRLRVPGIVDDNADIKQLVKDALDSDRGRDWLMVVDNADDLEILMSGSAGNDARARRLIDYLPASERGKIIFTTRNRKAAGNLTHSSVLELRDIGRDEARQLLERRIVNQALLADMGAVYGLLAELANHPLAIVQAAGFMSSTDTPAGEYLSMLQDMTAASELFGERFEDPSRYQEMDSTIARTWHISFDQIRRQDALAADYLSFMACIDRISIPQSLLPPCDSPVQRTKALGTLKGYAFIAERQQASQEVQGEKFFEMHRLVHMASIWWLDGHGERANWTDTAAARLAELVPYGAHENKGAWITYLPHAIHVAGPDSVLNVIHKAAILDRVGRCQSSLGQYGAAERSQRQVLSIREKMLGREHEHTLVSMNEIVVALHFQGEYDAAEAMNRRGMVIKERVLGSEHPETLTSMNNLAVELERQGKYEEAEAIGRGTLARQEKVLGAEHPNTLISMSNLASVLNHQGKNKEAEAMNRDTLARQEKVLGIEHPSTLTTMGNLALLLDRQGKYEEAEAITRDTLTRREKVLGAEHPNTLTSVFWLAYLLAKQHRYNEADPLYQRACAGRNKVLGPAHPHTRECQQKYLTMLELQEEYRYTRSPVIPPKP